jgi:Ca-activated chloride channel family protein
VSLVASRIADPVLTDVRVRTNGDVRLSKILPEQPVDLFAGQDLVLLARYAGHGDTRVIFEGKHRGRTVRWESTVDFPDRERDNPFVARLWATQRVGWLAAEKRKNGGSTEIDDEIRGLGERFGIPTEFTSYLVQEPQAVATGLMRRAGGAPAPMAASVRERAFESAKAASAQRAMTSMASLDSMSVSGANGTLTKRAGSRTFTLRDGMWTDARIAAGSEQSGRTVRIKAFSKAYFDLIQAVPELRAIFAVGDKVTARGRNVTLVVSDSGVEELSGSELKGIVNTW